MKHMYYQQSLMFNQVIFKKIQSQAETVGRKTTYKAKHSHITKRAPAIAEIRPAQKIAVPQMRHTEASGAREQDIRRRARPAPLPSTDQQILASENTAPTLHLLPSRKISMFQHPSPGLGGFYLRRSERSTRAHRVSLT